MHITLIFTMRNKSQNLIEEMVDFAFSFNFSKMYYFLIELFKNISKKITS